MMKYECHLLPWEVPHSLRKTRYTRTRRKRTQFPPLVPRDSDKPCVDACLSPSISKSPLKFVLRHQGIQEGVFRIANGASGRLILIKFPALRAWCSSSRTNLPALVIATIVPFISPYALQGVAGTAAECNRARFA